MANRATKFSAMYGFVVLLGISFLGSSKAQGSGFDPLSRKYEVEADFRAFETGTVSVRVEAEIRNESDRPIDELLWVLFPNRFRTELPNLNDLNYRRIYADGFSPGGIEIEDLRVGSRPAKMEPASADGVPSGTLERLRLPESLAPKAIVTISIRYRLQIPKKYGSFGRYRGRLTMSGGWVPYVASFRDGRFHPEDLPPRADWNFSIQKKGDLIVNGRVFPASEDQARGELPGARETSIFLAKSF